VDVPRGARFSLFVSNNQPDGGAKLRFLVEPTSEWAVGVYTIRVQAANGLSNVLLFSVGAFPEIVEEESRPGSLPHQNDSIERAQSLPSTPVTVNGTLQGAENDVYRIQAKAGERRVFEVDARRCGSAIDPFIRVMDGAGKVLARSDDDPLLSLDARIDITFPKDGFYYVEVHDARFSTQTQNFYPTHYVDITAVGERTHQAWLADTLWYKDVWPLHDLSVECGDANVVARWPKRSITTPKVPHCPRCHDVLLKIVSSFATKAVATGKPNARFPTKIRRDFPDPGLVTIPAGITHLTGSRAGRN
jgi:hypothetical protein